VLRLRNGGRIVFKTDQRTSAFEYYARYNAALFPIPSGKKEPFGIVPSFKHDWSRDPEQWKKWEAENPGCNFGIVAFASNLVICDIDTSGGEAGRAEAWQTWSDLCVSWGLPGPLSPHCQSQSGGWHCYFAVPSHIDAATLRQPDAIKKRINVRCVGYTVAAGSEFEGRPYQLFPGHAPPHPAPAALVAHCTRAAPRARVSTAGSRDSGDVAALLRWLAERDAFADYESWFQVGMALRLEFGDDGLDLWDICHDGTVSPGEAESKWQSFATDPTSESVTLDTFLKRAHALGWKGSIRKSTAAMFSEVANLAAMSGASLASGMPTSPSAAGMPMMAGQTELTRLAAPTLQAFLDATDATWSQSADLPLLPAAMESHGLFPAMQDAIARIVHLAEAEAKGWKPSRFTAPLAVLSVLHADVFAAVCRRVETLGRTLHTSKIKLAAGALADNVQRAFVKQDDWIYDARSGLPESDNPDNVVTFLGILSAEVRWNSWLNRAEIQGFEWPKWSPIDDTTLAKLKMRALRTGTRFRVGNEFLKETLLALAHDTQFDPVLSHINSLVWDGTPRLSHWLSETLGVPRDAYHTAVGRNVIGGMVKRARQPGCKHDEVMILLGAQGTLKSSMCRVLAMQDDWFTDSVAFEGSPQNIIPQLFGKLVCELAELDGMAKKEVQHIKAFITRQSDNVTLKYKAFASDYPRRCIFIGSSNDDAPLVDMTGNRRFLPVRVSAEANLTWLQEHVSQLVAEAATLEAAGAEFSIPRDVWAAAGEHQEAARSVGDIEARLIEWFGETAFTASAFVTTADLAELADLVGWKGQHTLRNGVLRRLGFREVQCYVGAQKVRAWFRGPDMLPRHIAACPRYQVSRSAEGRARVKIGMGGPGPVLPPLPY
jgi:hypothetical protein